MTLELTSLSVGQASRGRQSSLARRGVASLSASFALRFHVYFPPIAPCANVNGFYHRRIRDRSSCWVTHDQPKKADGLLRVTLLPKPFGVLKFIIMENFGQMQRLGQ
ncbi:hypothetical protein EUGRSUZ_H01339 [Eucalyptus grandis]|uniref:Uncharacterized protein n=2 Tax=Eucalyptus grandis TaxID=71139 RepID=A0ACC3JPB9_EUCGR|nr:hypothetical protein EUGRSUZ_H01339 [Eucalyptus grandis]